MNVGLLLVYKLNGLDIDKMKGQYIFSKDLSLQEGVSIKYVFNICIYSNQGSIYIFLIQVSIIIMMVECCYRCVYMFVVLLYEFIFYFFIKL